MFVSSLKEPKQNWQSANILVVEYELFQDSLLDFEVIFSAANSGFRLIELSCLMYTETS